MIIRTLINAFLLITLYSVAAAANSGSSATAITTITANIVPAASFSLTAPVILNLQTSKPASASNAILKMTDTGIPTRFKVNSNQNLIYDVSMPSLISASNNKK